MSGSLQFAGMDDLLNTIMPAYVWLGVSAICIVGFNSNGVDSSTHAVGGGSSSDAPNAGDTPLGNIHISIARNANDRATRYFKDSVFMLFSPVIDRNSLFQCRGRAPDKSTVKCRFSALSVSPLC